ncbi:MAG: putative ABC transporter permease [Lachnospiraceae bacterium]
MYELRQNFIKCGLVGWCMEVLFTGLHSIARHDPKMMGQTSILMFPIYGAAAFFGPISRLLKKRRIWARGTVYTCCIFAAEYVSGSLLKKRKMCPWDYSDAKFNINGLIRLDYAPLWFTAGLIFEKLVAPDDRSGGHS